MAQRKKKKKLMNPSNRRKRTEDLMGSMKSNSLKRMMMREDSGLGSMGSALAGSPRRKKKTR